MTGVFAERLAAFLRKDSVLTSGVAGDQLRESVQLPLSMRRLVLEIPEDKGVGSAVAVLRGDADPTTRQAAAGRVEADIVIANLENLPATSLASRRVVTRRENWKRCCAIRGACLCCRTSGLDRVAPLPAAG